MTKEETAKQIIKAVGTKDNIHSVWHCMTRLRFDLKEIEKVDYDNLESIPIVKGTKYQSGQLQVVIGTNVVEYFEEISKMLEMKTISSTEHAEKKSVISKFMDIISGVFGPIVPAMAGAGMIKGILIGLATLGMISNSSDTYRVIDMIASGVFIFLPFLVASSAAKIFKTNQYLAIAVAAILQYSTTTHAVVEGNIYHFMLFNMIPVPIFNYANTFIPVILSVLCLSYVYRWIDKILPKVLRVVFTPTLSLFISGLLALTIIGPIGIHLGNFLAWIIEWFFDMSPLLGGIFFGAIRPIAILSGLHHAMTPIALQNFANNGWDMLMPMMFMANMAITGATAAVYFKVKDRNEKANILSSAVSGLLGITEPALFGVFPKYKKAFYAATIGSAISSAFISFFGVRIYGYILSNIFSLPAYIGEYFFYVIIGITIAIASSFLVSYILVAKNDDVQVSDKVILHAVAKGKYVPLESVNDAIFSGKMVGDGYAILPNEGTIYSPVSGTIETVFPTKHAIGIKTESGVEILIHMGIDTVELHGKGFELFVKQGQKVTKGQKIAKMDICRIKKLEKDTTIMVVVTNMNIVSRMVYVDDVQGEHQQGDVITQVFLSEIE